MVIPEWCDNLKDNGRGIYCETCATYWVHGVCRCESILRVGCECEECKKPAPMPIKGTIKGLFIKGIELPNGAWIVEVTKYHKRFLGFIGRKKPPAVLRAVGYGYSWKYLDTMNSPNDKIRLMLNGIYGKLCSGKL